MTQIDHIVPAQPNGSDADLESGEGLRAPLGRRRFLAGVGATAGAAALASVLPVGNARAEGTLPVGASKFVPLPVPLRLADTDPKAKEKSYVDLPGNVIRIPLAGLYGIPANASAIVATITMENNNPITGNVATLYPSQTVRPKNLSNLNSYQDWQQSANLAVVKLGVDGAVEFHREFKGRIIFDALGFYVPVTGPVAEGRFFPLDEPKRVLDTREDAPYRRKLRRDEVISVDLARAQVPADASAVVINITIEGAEQASFYTVYPYAYPDGRPRGADRGITSSVNVSDRGEMRAGAVVCAVQNIDNVRRVNVYANYPANVILDVFGYFSGPTSDVSTRGLFVPASPVRIKDTRDAGPAGIQWSGWSLEVDVPRDAALYGEAIVANVTMVQPRRPNVIKALRARVGSNVFSNVNNYRQGLDVPNLVYSKISKYQEKPDSAGFQIVTDYPTHIVVDYAGYFVGDAPTVAAGSRPKNPAPGEAPLPWRIIFNKGISENGGNVMPPVIDGDAVKVTDAGGVWHWQGSGMVGGAGQHPAVFAHRTETANAPFKFLHNLGPGDTWTVDTADGRRYTYAYADRYITDAAPGNILEATRRIPGNTFAMIACTIGGNGANRWDPTSTKYRIVVVGTEIGWVALEDKMPPP